MKKSMRMILFLGAISFWSSATMAQSSSDDGRAIILAPYLWATGMSGTSTVGTLPPVDFDVSFGDLLSNVDMALSLHTEFRFDDWVFVVDPTYISVSMDAGLPPPLPADAVLDIEVEIWLVELWAGYRLNEKWEAIGGLRFQSQDLDIGGFPSPPSVTPSVEAGEDWTDWFIGFRFKTDISDKWFVTWRGDVGIAGDSDSSWNTSIFFNRRYGDSKALNIGYRYFVDDFDEPGVYAWDVTQDGPAIGYTWKF